MTPAQAKIVIIAGPNGAGKTTLARAFLPEEAQCPRFINADLIAAGLSPFAPDAAAIRAARVMLDELASCAQRRESFAFETTLSGLAYLRHIEGWRGMGYHVSRFFLALPSAEVAIARVAERVWQGGHDIPQEMIRRRFDAGRRNFDQQYRDAVGAWALYDNSGDEPLRLEWGNDHDRTATFTGQGQRSCLVLGGDPPRWPQCVRNGDADWHRHHHDA